MSNKKRALYDSYSYEYWGLSPIYWIYIYIHVAKFESLLINGLEIRLEIC